MLSTHTQRFDNSILDLSNQFGKVVLVLGFLSLSLSAMIAHMTPAVQYESSILHGTPTTAWVGIISALIVSVFLSYYCKGILYKLSIFLSGISIFTIVLLPRIRGYYFLGEHDAMTHIGWARDLSNNVIEVSDVLYPGLHTLSVFFSEAGSIPIPQSLLLNLFFLTGLYLIFVPLVVRRITSSRRTVTIATYSSLMILPLNIVKLPTLQAIPFTAATFFIPLVLYSYIYLLDRKSARARSIFLVSSTSLVLFHVQQAMVLVAVLLLLFIYSIIYDRLVDESSRPSIWRYSIFEMAYLSVFIVLWLGSKPAFLGQVIYTITLILSLSIGQDIASANRAAASTGSNLLILIAKLFIVDFIYLGLSFITIAQSSINEFQSLINGKSDDKLYEFSSYSPLFTIGMLLIGILIVIFFLSGESQQYFRYIGIFMIFATIVGSITINRILNKFEYKYSLLSDVFPLVITLLLLMSLLAIYPSPYISKPTSHITEARIDGFETAFEYSSEDIQFIEIYSPVFRYRDAIYGRQKGRFGNGIPGAQEVIDTNNGSFYAQAPSGFNNQRLSETYIEARYLTVTASDRYRALKLYDGEKYSRNDFAYLNRSQDVSKIYSNKDLKLYLIEG